MIYFLFNNKNKSYYIINYHYYNSLVICCYILRKETYNIMNYEIAKKLLKEYNQEHLLQFYDELSEINKQKLLNQIEQIDFSLLTELEKQKNSKRGTFKPVDAVTLKEIEKNKKEYFNLGVNAIKSQKVGAVLLAGGQGTRLGFSHPKGMFNIGVNRNLYIFECLFNNLKDIVFLTKTYVPIFIMTSESNDKETRTFLKIHDYFGYNPDYVHFFIQEMAPVIDENSKILLSEKDKIAMSPNGNGGWFSSMQRAGLLDKIQEMGILWLNVFAVDNVLQRIADPCFIGATILSRCSAGGKVVAKAAPDERVGVLCLENDRPSIVEYYEMTEEMRTRREPDGRLSYNYGVILNYLFRVDTLIQTLKETMPLHMAHKIVPYIDENGNCVTPSEPNAYKFETLVLDMIRLQENCLSFEVDREREFAPVKNATGTDSVDTARELLEKNGVSL